MPIEVPFIQYGNIVALAEAALVQHHPTRAIPVPVEDIIDVGYAINIVPTHGLEARFGTVAYISQDLQDIRVDDYVYRHQSYRLNFSLAHELAHLVLHKHVYRQMNFETPQEWKAAMELLSDDEYRRLEWQADCFAGLLLVSPTELRNRFDQIALALDQAGRRFEQLDEPAQNYAVKGLARQFNVSTGTIWFRLRDERLI